MTNAHIAKGPRCGHTSFSYCLPHRARRTGLNAKVPDMMAEGAKRWGAEGKRDGVEVCGGLNKRGSKRETEKGGVVAG